MEWIWLILNEPGAKARFTAIILTSLVAFSLFFLNQYFLTKREDKRIIIDKKREHEALLILKIEELYKAGIDYFSCYREFCAALSNMVCSNSKPIKIISSKGVKELSIAKVEKFASENFELTEQYLSNIKELKKAKAKIEMILNIYFSEYQNIENYPKEWLQTKIEGFISEKVIEKLKKEATETEEKLYSYCSNVYLKKIR